MSAATTVEHWHAAAKDASLGVGHDWTAVRCPAYRTLDPADCTCTAEYIAREVIPRDWRHPATIVGGLIALARMI